MTPKTAALRFRIWQYASVRDWNVTVSEVADALGVDPKSIGVICQHAGWLHRFRATSREINRAIQLNGPKWVGFQASFGPTAASAIADVVGIKSRADDQ